MFKNLKLIYRTLDNTLKVRFLKVFIFNNITVILETFGIGILFIILNVSTSKSYYGDFYSKFIDIFSFNLKEENLIIFLLIFFVIFFIIKLFFIVFTRYYEQSTMQKAEYFYIRLFLNKYFNTSLLHFTSFNSAKLVTNMQKEVSLFVNHIIFNYVAIVSEVFLCIMFLTFLLYVNFKVTFFIIFFFIFISSFYIFFFKKKLKSIGIERQKSDVDYLQFLNESFYLIKEIKIFLLQNFLINKFNVIVFKRFKIVLQELIINQLPRLLLEFFLIVLSVIFFVYLILSNYNIMSYIALFGTYIFAFLKVLPSANRIIQTFNSINFNYAAGRLVISLLKDTKYNQMINTLNKNEKISYNFNNYKKIKSISFDKISFDYSDSKKLINKLNIKFKLGEFNLIKGDIGSGKTTLLNILSGLIQPINGNVCINGAHINNYPIHTRVGFVHQNSFILDDTLINNVCLGLSKQEIIKEKFINILKELNIYYLHQKFGDNVRLGERGNKLSGGEQQKVAIARVLYRNREILLFDEATSSLDLKSEKEICELINKFKKTKIIIFVSHKESIEKYSDKIFLFKKKK